MSAGPGRFIRPPKMEIACTRAGVWRVEGYDVECWRQDGKNWWHVFTRRAVQSDETQPFSVVETFHGKRRTLTAACELVDDLLSVQ